MAEGVFIIEYAFVLCCGEYIDVFDFPVEILQMEYQPANPSPEPGSQSTPSRRMPLTPDLLLELLSESDWNKAEVARKTGYSRAAIWKYMKKLDMPLNRKSIEHRFFRYFGTITTWHLQFHLTCDKLWQSCIGSFSSSALKDFPGGRTY